MVARPLLFALAASSMLALLAVTAGCDQPKKPEAPAPMVPAPGPGPSSTTNPPDITRLPVDSSPPPPVVTPTDPTPPPVGGSKVHTVVKGDTLMGLCRQYYGPTQGTNANVKKILDANPGLDPKNLKIGTKINIP